MANKIEKIANEIVGYSDGAWTIAWSEEYEALTQQEQQKVSDLVFEQIGDCYGCGWNFMYDSLETDEHGECYCWRCYEDKLAEDDEE